MGPKPTKKTPDLVPLLPRQNGSERVHAVTKRHRELKNDGCHDDDDNDDDDTDTKPPANQSINRPGENMNTYTHFLWAVCIARWILSGKLRWRPNGRLGATIPSFDTGGALLGSVLPDLPLIATTAVCFVHDRINNDGDHHDDDDDSDSDEENPSWTHRLFESWYFTNPWVLAEHNLFHSPVSLGLLLSIVLLWHNTLRHRWCCAGVSGWCCCCRGCRRCGNPGFWFWVLASAFVHAVCDIPVHHDDGPLLLWPFDWSTRYVSPVSYWDPDHYGIPVSIAEHLLDAAVVFWLWHVFCYCSLCRCCFRHRAGGGGGGTGAPSTTTTMTDEAEKETAITSSPMSSGGSSSATATNHDEVEVIMVATPNDRSGHDKNGVHNDDDDEDDEGIIDV